MIRILWLFSFMLVSAGVNADSLTRYRPKLHVFFDSGLRIIEMKATFAKEDACYAAGEREAKRKYRKVKMVPVYCEPIHFIANEGKIYT